MLIRRSRFFLVLFGMLIIPLFVQKIIWLARSEKAIGTVGFTGKRYAGQMVYTYAVVSFMVGKDTVWFNGRNDILFEEGERVPVRYLRKNPAEARLDVFLAIWGDTLVYGGIPVLILLIIFLHPQIVPRRSKIQLTTIRPFIMIVE
jgi:Protein of unknown function (DUF3592)